MRGIPKGVTEEQLREKFSTFDVHIHTREGETKRTTVEKPKIVSLVMKDAKVYEGKPESQFAYIMYEKVEAAQRAIQIFNGAFVFGSASPILVEFWMSKEDKEKERKRKEDQQTRKLVNTLIYGAKDGSVQGIFPPPPVYQGRQQSQGNYQNQNNNTNSPPQRNNGGNHRGNRGGNNHRGGRGGYQNRNNNSSSQGPRQAAQYQQAPAQQHQMQLQLFLPIVDMDEFKQQANADARKNFVGNLIYPSIEQAFGAGLAGRITGMLLDESVIDFNKLIQDTTYFTNKAIEANTLLQNSAQA